MLCPKCQGQCKLLEVYVDPRRFQMAVMQGQDGFIQIETWVCINLKCAQGLFKQTVTKDLINV